MVNEEGNGSGGGGSSSGERNAMMRRSDEETYFKYMGEEVLRNSGLSYSIVRVSGYNESPSGESESVRQSETE